ncbi:MAG: hypothetical protein GY702_10340 [Desulfobulbaceae bacterium]|nr:hypothetical protein [Desulfobulbaceae bacterium]
MLSFINRFLLFLFSPLRLLEPFKVLSILKVINRLEKDNNYSEAKTLRKSWLSRIKSKNCAPLWLSEGKYELNIQKDYKRALIAFEDAIEAHQKQPLYYGSVNPLDMLYGAAVCAFMLGKTEKGKEYYKEFEDYYDRFLKNKTLKHFALRHSEGKKWLQHKLDEETKQPPT